MITAFLPEGSLQFPWIDKVPSMAANRVVSRKWSIARDYLSIQLLMGSSHQICASVPLQSGMECFKHGTNIFVT